MDTNLKQIIRKRKGRSTQVMSKLLDDVVSRENMKLAYKSVIANKGASGIDNISVDEIKEYVNSNWEDIKTKIQERRYKPLPVKRVEIPKANGGIRNLGIPTVMDRIIQQALVQVLTPICEPHFSDYSYGFRPRRSCEQAILKILEYLNDEYSWIVDIDLEKFFDNVPQDKLMSYVHTIVNDGDVESLIRKYLQAGVMVKGEYQATKVGTPQGGNLSPLLSNIMLNELDKELESRGLHFTRYADDCVIAVKSESSAKRVMRTITTWIERKLGLKVNMSKTHITKPTKLKYLGFGFYRNSKTMEWHSRPHQDSIKSFQRKLKQLTCRKNTMAFQKRIKQLNLVIRGWINYYAITDMKTVMTRIDAHLRTRLRVILWKQWKVPQARRKWLIRLGIDYDKAKQTSYMGDHYQWVVTKTCVVRAISKKRLTQNGLVSCLDYYLERHDLKFN